MKKLLAILLISIVSIASSFAQSDKTIIFAGMDALRGVGKTNLNFCAGFNARIQYPIAPNLALTAKVGAELYKMSGFQYGLTSTGLAYGYNPITGWGFNRLEPRGGLRYFESRGVVIPAIVGVRYYLPAVLKGLHADLGLGRDFAVTKTIRGTFRVEPSVGYTLTLGNGQFMDFSAVFVSGLQPGANIAGLSIAYGFPVKF